MVAEKLIVGGFYFVDHFVSNINTNEFTDKKKYSQTKRIYQHHSIGNFIDEQGILPTEKTVCNSIDN
jgi:hypothetical protein